MRRRARKETGLPISKNLRIALLRSYKGQHGEKEGLYEGITRGNWDSQEGQQPFRPNPNGIGDSTTTLRGLLIGAVMECRD